MFGYRTAAPPRNHHEYLFFNRISYPNPVEMPYHHGERAYQGEKGEISF